MTPQDQAIDKARTAKLRNTIKRFVKSRELFYKKRGFTRTNEAEALTLINRYYSITQGCRLSTNMKRLVQREAQYLAVMPKSIEDPDNMQLANDMQACIRQCKIELGHINSTQSLNQLSLAS
jgi:hypothetical protein